MNPDQILKVALKENPSTGFTWNIKQLEGCWKKVYQRFVSDQIQKDEKEIVGLGRETLKGVGG